MDLSTGGRNPEPSYGIGRDELLRRWRDRVTALDAIGQPELSALLTTMLSQAERAPTDRAAAEKLCGAWIEKEIEMRKTNSGALPNSLRQWRREAQEALDLVVDPRKYFDG